MTKLMMASSDPDQHPAMPFQNRNDILALHIPILHWIIHIIHTVNGYRITIAHNKNGSSQRIFRLESGTKRNVGKENALQFIASGLVKRGRPGKLAPPGYR